MEQGEESEGHLRVVYTTNVIGTYEIWVTCDSLHEDEHSIAPMGTRATGVLGHAARGVPGHAAIEIPGQAATWVHVGMSPYFVRVTSAPLQLTPLSTSGRTTMRLGEIDRRLPEEQPMRILVPCFCMFFSLAYIFPDS